MPLLPLFSRLVAQAALPEAERARLARLHYADAGHGYDAFGLHPDVVARLTAAVEQHRATVIPVRSQLIDVVAK